MNLVPLRIHIAVVGFEIDRISQAAIKNRADKVYLISKKEEDDGLIYLKKNEEILKNKGIFVIIELIDDVHDIICILDKLKNIIKREKENLIYINISSGSNLSAVAGTISSMMFDKDYNIIPYYVKPEKYLDCDEIRNEKSEYGQFPKLRTTGVKEIVDIVTFPTKLPTLPLIKVLKKINSEKEGTITKKKLLLYIGESEETAKQFNYPYFEKSSSSSVLEKAKNYAWLNQNIIEKLKNEWNFIEVQKEGKSSNIYLTQKGKNMLKYLDDEPNC
ncbi:DUF6293 family protein [Methanolapillus ohkumae]|uniref:Uncharacterized protein n=1 Tax=Methanolapillus ohkumae TaxID=3028298 RepID=A0AA96V6D5_9EURY|nr:hypothetical protein MsAm2_05470 [Methanosarcinaceae archaeon Am2]